MGTMKITNNYGPREFGSKGMATTISVQGPYSSPPNDLVLNPLNSWIYNKPGNSQNDGKKRHTTKCKHLFMTLCKSSLFWNWNIKYTSDKLQLATQNSSRNILPFNSSLVKTQTSPAKANKISFTDQAFLYLSYQ